MLKGLGHILRRKLRLFVAQLGGHINSLDHGSHKRIRNHIATSGSGILVLHPQTPPVFSAALHVHCPLKKRIIIKAHQHLRE